MKRRTFLATAAVAGLAGTLSACGAKDNAETGQSTTLDPNTTAELTLSYWDKAQTPTVEANIKAFNEKYPNITVTPSIAGYEDYWARMRTQAEGGDLPDVFWMNGPNFQLYASNGMLAELDDLSDVAWDKYPTALRELYSLDGKAYGIPKDYDTIACFINTKIFEQAGVELPAADWTWEDHHKIAQAIADSGAGYGVVVDLGGQVSYYNTIYQAGGYVIKEGKSGYDDPKTVKGIKFWADHIASGAMPPMEIAAETPSDQLFLAGKAGIHWGGSWEVKPLLEAFPNGEIKVVPLPKGETQATIIHGLAYAASAKSKNLAAAKALVKALTDQAAAETEASNGTAIPAYAGTQTKWLEQAPEMGIDEFTTAAETYAIPFPVSKNTSAWMGKESELLSPVFTGKTSAEEGCKQLATEMNAALEAE